MKTKPESESIQKCLDELVKFLNTLAKETSYGYSYPIIDATYDNNTEVVNLKFGDGYVLEVNVNMDSVPLSMKDVINSVFREFY